MERPHDPQPLHHPDDPVPDRLQHLSADLLARLLVHRFPRLDQRAGEFRRAAELPRAAQRCPFIWYEFLDHRQIRDRLGERPGAGRLRRRAAAQPPHSLQGPDHDAAAPADDAVDGRRRPVLEAALRPVLRGIINYVLGLGTFEWLSNPDMALYAVAITDIWMWSPFVMLLSLAGLSAVPQAPLRGGGDRPRRRAATPSSASRLPLVAPILMIAIIFRTMEAFKTFDLAYILTSQPTHRSDLDPALQDGVPGVADRAAPARSPTSC